MSVLSKPYFQAVGEKRGRYYIGDAPLMKIADRTRDTTRAGDPYELVVAKGGEGQMALAI